MRTDHCGELRAGDAGREVGLCGWVAAGASTASTSPSSTSATTPASCSAWSTGPSTCAASTCVRVTGTVRLRPEGTVNPNLPTGEVEVGDCEVEVLSAAEPPPFPIDARADDVDETSASATATSTCGASGCSATCASGPRSTRPSARAMERQGFVEVETPMLMPSTPEGAREFLVPSRQSPGSFYALPQSPQLFKQLLMVGGVDRYYQIARCLRDEDLRADRQYEFMQLDAEMSFVDQDDVLAAITEAVLDAAEAVTGERPPPIPRITWHEAMDRYGVDKPDLRFGMELVELTDGVRRRPSSRRSRRRCVKGIRVPGSGRGATAATSSTTSPTGPSSSGPRAWSG